MHLTTAPMLASTESDEPTPPPASEMEPEGEETDIAPTEVPEIIPAEDDLPDPPLSPSRNQGDLAKRRRGFVEPLNRESQIEGDFTSDDEFLEELRSATFQEAKPITMARSPMAPTFPRRTSATSAHPEEQSLASAVHAINIVSKSSSNAPDHEGDSQHPGGPEAQPRVGRSPSPSPAPAPERGESRPGFKRNVSSGITQRIQALNQVSTRDSSMKPGPSILDNNSNAPHAMWRSRKSSVRGRPGSRRRSSNTTWQSDRSSSHATSGPEGGDTTEHAPVWTVQHDPASHRDSISVKARIVRPVSDVGSDHPARADESLRPSHLVINHKRASASPAHSSLDPVSYTHLTLPTIYSV